MHTDPSPVGFEFTSDQLRVLASHPEQALHIRVAETNKVYLLIEEGVLTSLDEDYIRQGLVHAADQAARGDEAAWDPAEIKATGRELLARRNSSK